MIWSDLENSVEDRLRLVIERLLHVELGFLQVFADVLEAARRKAGLCRGTPSFNPRRGIEDHSVERFVQLVFCRIYCDARTGGGILVGVDFQIELEIDFFLDFGLGTGKGIYIDVVDIDFDIVGDSHIDEIDFHVGADRIDNRGAGFIRCNFRNIRSQRLCGTRVEYRDSLAQVLDG